jgi:uncharacterized Tic20 family protein
MKEFLENFGVFFIIFLGLIIVLSIIIGLGLLIITYTSGILQVVFVVLLIAIALSFIFATLQAILS